MNAPNHREGTWQEQSSRDPEKVKYVKFVSEQSRAIQQMRSCMYATKNNFPFGFHGVFNKATEENTEVVCKVVFHHIISLSKRGNLELQLLSCCMRSYSHMI